MPKKSDVIAAGVGVGKSLASKAPILSEIIAGFDSYRSARFERETKEFLHELDMAIGKVEGKFDGSWFTSSDGERFARKVLDCAVDAQLADKKQLFANAFINGAISEELNLLEKFKFIDILRQLSLSALMVLADMHKILGPDARRPGRTPPMKPYPLVDQKQIAERLSSNYDPYLVEASLYEMQGQGLFSNTGQWNRQADGSSRIGGGYSDALAYTDFTCRFVKFITI